MYCEIRQLITYVKEAHGSTFRRVALSGLLDTADRPNKKDNNIQTTRVIRYLDEIGITHKMGLKFMLYI